MMSSIAFPMSRWVAAGGVESVTCVRRESWPRRLVLEDIFKTGRIIVSLLAEWCCTG